MTALAQLSEQDLADNDLGFWNFQTFGGSTQEKALNGHITRDVQRLKAMVSRDGTWAELAEAVERWPRRWLLAPGCAGLHAIEAGLLEETDLMREQRVEVLRMVVDGPDERFAKDMGAVAVDNCLIDEFTEVLRARIPGNFAPMELSPSDGDRITLSMRLIRHLVPDLWQEMSSWHLRFVPLELQPPAARQSCSDRQVPGTVWATVDPDPFELIDLIVHEFFHLRLFQLEEEYRLLRNPAVPCLSPFRPDLRNAEGLLQAVYVAAGLSTVFEKIYQRTTPSRRGIRRLAVWRESVRTGIQLLRESGATPTGAGRQLIDSMWVCNESAQARLRQDVPFMANWAGSVVAEHLAQAGKPDSAGPWFLAI